MKRHTLQRSVAINIGEAEFEFEVSFEYTPDDPGQCSGLPERCYPPEPAEVEVQSIHYRDGANKLMDASWMLDNWDFADELEGMIHAIMESE